MDTIQQVDTGRIWTLIQQGVNQYNQETDDSFRLDDVLIVGSVASGEYQPYKSDLDLIILVSGGSESGVVGGLDVLLREEYSRSLTMCIDGATETDIGVYTETSYIEDSTAFSCGSDSFVSL